MEAIKEPTLEAFSHGGSSQVRGMSMQSASQKPQIDPHTTRLLQFVFGGSKGNSNRARLVSLLKKEPLNVNQLSKKLDLNYRTIRHHIKVLEKNNLVSSVGDKYGAMFFPSTLLEVNMPVFDKIATKVNKK